MIRFEHRHSMHPMESRHFKGGDGGAGQMRADEAARQAKIQAAVDAINAKFGVGQGAARVMPTESQFTTGGTPGSPAVSGGFGFSSREGDMEIPSYQAAVPGTPGSFDSAGFAKAMADYNAGGSSGGNTRQGLYDDISGATRDVAMRGLDRQFTQASKQNLFGLARSGLLGGSVDAEAGGDLQQRYGEGKIKAEAAGVGAASDLKSMDERTRQNLISLAQSGIDTGTASSLAAGQMAAAADTARAGSNSANIGRLFDDMGQAYLANTVAQARYPNGLPPQQQGASLFGNLFSGKGFAGRVQG